MKICTVLIVLFGFFGRCLPLRMELIGNLKEIVIEKKIKLRVVLEGQEAAVYADQLNFSIDGDVIALHKPIILVTPTQQFVPLNKSIKAIYSTSFEVGIKFEAQRLQSLKEIASELEKNKIFMSSLLLFRDGTSQSKTVFLSLNQHQRIGQSKYKSIKLFTDGKFVENNREILDESSCWHEIALFDQVTACWTVLVDKVCCFFSSDWFFILYSLLLVVILFFGVFRILPFTRILFFNAPWKREMIKALVLFEMGLSFKILQFFCELYFVFYLLAIFFFVMGLFYVRGKYPAESILSKFRITIGLILIGLVLPFLTKGWMISLR